MKHKYFIYSFYAESSLPKDELIERLSKIPNIQICDGSISKEFLNYAVFNALKSFENKENISKDLKIEILLLASGTRQISEAIKRAGIKDPKNITVCYFGSPGNLKNIMKKLKQKLKLKRKREKKKREEEKKVEKNKLYEDLIRLLKLKVES